jgi:penicillin amidase
MKLLRIIRTLVIGLLVLSLVVVAGVGGAFFYFSRQSFPQTSGTARLPGLTGNVDVIRDALGVPHIYADTPEDLFRAQGYVHAQDRFFQMEFWRRIGQGRIAELFGAGAVDQDKFIRTIGWARVAAEEEKSLDADSRTVLENYAAGVNAYAQPNADKLGFEFKVLGLIGRQWTPEPWTPMNTLTWGKAMSYNLGGNMDQELARMMLKARGGDDLVDLIFPPYPDDMPVIVRTAQKSGATNTDGKETRRQGEMNDASLSGLTKLYALHTSIQNAIGLGNEPGLGSNNWVVAGSRTETGKPLLANDPHLGIQMPSIWYLNGLHCRVVSPSCPYDVVGVTFPGTPGVVLGHNARIAWGVTNVGPDTQDFFIEKQNPNNANEFEFEGKFESAQVREEVIKVAGKDPITITVRVTRHGPIMNDAITDFELAQPMALRWTALQPSPIVRSVLAINRAQNWAQFREALQHWDSPSQNFVYADVEGNIGYQMPGNVPIRKSGNGRAPVPGWTGEFEWVDRVPFDQLPSIYNPPEGYIVTANNAVVDAKSYPFLLGTDWDYGYRAKRIEQLVTTKPKLTVEDMRLIQADSFSLFSREVMPYLRNMAIANDAAAKEALEVMRAWDGNCTVTSVGCTIFEVFWRELSHLTLDDDVGEVLADDIVGRASFSQITLRGLLPNANAKWWDNLVTKEVESRDQQIVTAIKATVATLQKQFGNDVATWEWGKLHAVTFPNQTLGRSGTKQIEDIFNRGPFPVSGGTALVNAQSHRSRSFDVTSGPSWRAVFDLNNWSKSIGIHTTGQSGHTYHPHYDDMIPLWLKGENATLPWTRGDVDFVARESMVLTP